MAHHGPVIDLHVQANTDRLTQKLRAIARHANELADDLAAIDAGTYTADPTRDEIRETGDGAAAVEYYPGEHA